MPILNWIRTDAVMNDQSQILFHLLNIDTNYNEKEAPMSPNNLTTIGGKTFEDHKQINDHGAEYWSARDLQPLLGYSQWRRFKQAIERAITSCKESGNSPDHHFAGAGKPITGGKGAVQVVEDYHLSRFAC